MKMFTKALDIACATALFCASGYAGDLVGPVAPASPIATAAPIVMPAPIATTAPIAMPAPIVMPPPTVMPGVSPLPVPPSLCEDVMPYPYPDPGFTVYFGTSNRTFE